MESIKNSVCEGKPLPDIVGAYPKELMTLIPKCRAMNAADRPSFTDIMAVFNGLNL